MNYRKIKLLLLLIIATFSLQAQNGGTGTYSFLDLPYSAKMTGLGGKNVSIKNEYNSFAFYNPSLINTDTKGGVNISYLNYVAAINAGMASYSVGDTKYGRFLGTIQYVNYGKFTEANQYGNILGSFSANEFALIGGWCMPILDSLITIGANSKFIFSQLEQYTSFGLAFDIGAYYQNESGNTSTSLIIRNIGLQLKSYNNTNEPLAMDIIWGISSKLEHAPFRFSATFHYLNNYNLAFAKKKSPSSLYEPEEERSKFNKISDEIMRHIILGVEFIPSKNFYISLGYNHKRRQEMTDSERKSITGFSIGTGIKVKKLNFDYSVAKYHLAGLSHHFSIYYNIFRK